MQNKFILTCECKRPEDTIQFEYDEESETFVIVMHLDTHFGFFKRLWYSLKYVFGRKAGYGCFSETIFNQKDAKELIKFLQNCRKENQDWP
jgi:hypothetical protein